MPSAFAFTSDPGNRLALDRVQTALDVMTETRSTELKASMSWPGFRPHLVKTSQAMANLGGGGAIILGIATGDLRHTVTGITPTDLATINPDNVADEINKYASNPIHADCYLHDAPGGLRLLAIVIEQSDQLVVCKKTGEGVQGGAIYIRPAGGRPQSRAACNAEEVDELIQRMVEARARALIGAVSRVSGNVAARDPFADERGSL